MKKPSRFGSTLNLVALLSVITSAVFWFGCASGDVSPKHRSPTDRIIFPHRSTLGSTPGSGATTPPVTTPPDSLQVFIDPQTPPGNGGPGIYLAGVGQNSEGTAVATYWKDGVPVNLAAIQSYAYSIAVSGNDIYVAGEMGGNATYWKNGVAVNCLPSQDLRSSLSSVFVSGNDVYVAGYMAGSDHGYALYWKNGIRVWLTKASPPIFAYSGQIVVSGDDVYVAGCMISDGKTYAVYWKNGIVNKLTDGNNLAWSRSIAVSGDDVYVTLDDDSYPGVAKYWKNGSVIVLTDGTTYSSANAIAVIGTDVYVAGITRRNMGGNDIVTYWKNGVVFNNPSDSVKISNAYSIAVDGEDVYVAGAILESTVNSSFYSSARYWKNGTGFALTSGSDGVNMGYAAFILVVR